MLTFGNEEHYEVMRVRIVTELMVNEELYTAPSYFVQDSSEDGSELLELLIQDVDILDKAGLFDLDIFEAEIFNIRKPNVTMSVWGIFAAANILQVPITSLYSDKGELAKQKLAKRTILPTADDTLGLGDPCYIMRTSHRDDMKQKDRWWLANHFVPLLSLHPCEEPSGTAENSTQEDLNAAFIENGSLSSDCNTLPVTDDFYSLQWEDNKEYVCQVKEIDDEAHEVLVHFMAKQGSMVNWDKLDASWENLDTFRASSERVSIVLNEENSTQRKQLFDVLPLP